MIKTPVSVGSIGTSKYHTSSCYPLLLDANFKPLNNECAKEAAKRINMHDELVVVLKRISAMCDMDGGSTIDELLDMQNDVLSLLERCK